MHYGKKEKYTVFVGAKLNILILLLIQVEINDR